MFYDVDVVVVVGEFPVIKKFRVQFPGKMRRRMRQRVVLAEHFCFDYCVAHREFNLINEIASDYKECQAHYHRVGFISTRYVCVC